MNKLLGFFELKDSSLPTVPWKEYRGDELDDDYLWTVRTAVHRGNDFNLPRCIGVTANEAADFAKKVCEKYRDNGMVVVYPYFLAEKSGTLIIELSRVIIEAVKDDLWNLVTEGYKDVTIIVEKNNKYFNGNETFLSENEIEELISYVAYVKKTFRDELIEGKGIQLEWSYAYKSDKKKNRVGDRYLVFYEARTVD